MKKYRISTLAGYRGISNNGVMFLERKGIIKSYRDKSNGYREFDDNAFVSALEVSSLQRLGLSLEEANGWFHMSPEELMEHCGRKQQDLASEYRERKKALELRISLCRRIQQKFGQLCLRKRPPLIARIDDHPAFLEAEQKRDKKTQERLLQNIAIWNAQMPWTFFGVCFGDSRDNIHFLRCSMATQETVIERRLPLDETTIRIDGGLCLSTIIVEPGSHYDPRILKPLFRYMDEHHLLVNGEITARILHLTATADDIMGYMELNVPIRKEK